MPSPMGVTQNQVQNSQPNAPVNQNAQPNNAPVVVWPFDKAASFHKEIGQTHTLAAAAWSGGVTDELDVPTYGWLSELVLTCIGSAGAKGSSSIVAPGEDSPWNLFSNINITDVAGTSIQITDGWSQYLAWLYGAYRRYRQDQSIYGYTPVDGTALGGGGTGNFLMKYHFPFEFAVDGIGCLPNMDGSGKYRVNLVYAAPSKFYNGASQQPGTLPAIQTIIELKARANPNPQDKMGNPQATQPPALGTLKYLKREVFTVNSGDNTIQLKNVGNTIRNHILTFRDANGSRSGAESSGVVPSTIQMDWDAGIRYKTRVDTLRQEMFENFGFDAPNGVIVFSNHGNASYGPNGNEYGNHWIQTVGSTLLQFEFTASAAGTLEVLTEYIVIASNEAYTAAQAGL